MGTDDELHRERAYIDAAYDRVVAMRQMARRMARSGRELAGNKSGQALFERDSAIGHAQRRLDVLDIAKDRMAVGRIDMDDGACLYIGRLSVADEHGDPLVVDWRAAAAAAFYQALPHDPMGVVRRRHFRWRHGELVGLDDEVFDLARARSAGLTLVGEGALLAALAAPRTGRMQDIVATIQAEQDEVIRRPRVGVTVVQGAPGTGKTAVALHRAAYLLYGERSRLTGSVLFVGPSATFLGYVEDVVPGLGEDRVVLATPAELGPDVAVTGADPPAVAALKGDRRMADVVAAAIRSYQRAPREGIEVRCGRFILRLGHGELKRVVAAGRRSADTHNGGRPAVERRLLAALDQAYVQALSRDHRARRVGAEAVTDRRPLLEVVDREDLTAAVHRIWPLLTPERLVGRLLRSPRRLRAAGRGLLSGAELDALCSADPGTGWSEADVALLDEADHVLGPLPAARRRRAGGRPRLDPVAERVLEDRVPDCPRCGRPMEYRPGRASGTDRLSCRECKADFRTTDLMGDPAANHLHGMYEELAHQFEHADATRIRPGDARYGHVVVDEAQDLSPMQWRAVARRCPSGSFTLAGDEAQAVRAGAAATWDAILEALGAPGDAVTRHELTVNYRTPAEVMEVAGRLLEHFAPHLHPARSVRSTGLTPALVVFGPHIPEARALAENVGALRRTIGDGLMAVIVAEGRMDDVRVDDADVLTAVDAKGLEFDGVIVLDPEAIVGDAVGTPGMSRLYVALTRTTNRLAVLAPAPPRAPLAGVLGDAAVRG